MIKNIKFVRIGINAGIVLATASLPASAGHGNGKIQEGEAGARLGATLNAYVDGRAGEEQLDSRVHDPGMPRRPPNPGALQKLQDQRPEQGPQQLPAPGPAPASVGEAPSGDGD